MTQGQFVKRIIKPALFVGWMIPFGLIVLGLVQGTLGANPVEEMTDRTGTTTLNALMATLAITPLARFTGIPALVTIRRMIGLFAYFYVILHFATFLVFDHFFLWSEIIADIIERPYITVGFTSLLLLTPLALTSTKGWIKRLGSKRWGALHKLVYVAAALGVLHYLWLVKADTRLPIVYAAILVALLIARLGPRKKRAARAPVERSATASAT